MSRGGTCQQQARKVENLLRCRGYNPASVVARPPREYCVWDGTGEHLTFNVEDDPHSAAAYALWYFTGQAYEREG